MTAQTTPMTTPMTPPQPLVLRSRHELEARGARFLPVGAPAPISLPIQHDGTTYEMAQETSWLDAEHFAVGRWDGSLSIFRFMPGVFIGPEITTIAASPSSEGVQMITWLTPRAFATSNDDGSMIVWRAVGGATWSDLKQVQVLSYDPAYGTANAGDALALGGHLYLIVGHANGYLTIWSGGLHASDFQLVRALDLRSPTPVNPWDLHNIRGVSVVHCGGGTALVVTGSEDGDLCMVRIPDGTVVSRTVFNPDAQRGINSIATRGRDLIVANCSVGPDDKNTWYYRMTFATGAIDLVDSVDLKVDQARPQAFNFCVVWGRYQGGPCFFASTEEGTLWMGTADATSGLSVIGYEAVTSPLGSALAYNVSGKLVMVAYDLYEYETQPAPAPAADGHPERMLDES